MPCVLAVGVALAYVDVWMLADVACLTRVALMRTELTVGS
jgi:hypothetical protein